MKKLFILGMVVILVGFFAVYFLVGGRDAEETPVATIESPQKTVYVVRGMPPDPPLVKIEGFPTTEQAKAQWKWWSQMMKKDIGFQWKMPMAFYGKVLDQFDNPVSGAKIDLEWTSDGYVPKRTVYTDANGLFRLEGAHGKRLTVSIHKKGYNIRRNGESAGSFEYADFSNTVFHVPDKNKPYIFRLQKLVDPEPLYRRISEFKIKPSQSVTMDAMRGKVEPLPMVINMERNLSSDEKQASYTFTIRLDDGAGLIETKMDYVIGTLAPEAQYQSEYVYSIPMRNAYGFSTGVMFFVKTPSGKYARMGISFLVGRDGEGRGSVTVVYNPSGSRNLESDESLIME